MHKLPKDGAVRAAWINAILTSDSRKLSYFCNGIRAWLIQPQFLIILVFSNPIPVYHKINPSVQ